MVTACRKSIPSMIRSVGRVLRGVITSNSRPDRDQPRHGRAGGGGDRSGVGAEAAPSGGLDARPRMHLLLRELHPLGASAHQGCRAVDDLARLRRHDHGRRGPSGRGDFRRDQDPVQRQIRARGRRQSAARRGRHVLHRRRQAVRRETQDDGRTRLRHHRLGRLRLLGLRASGQAQSELKPYPSTRSSGTSRSSRFPAARRSPRL